MSRPRTRTSVVLKHPVAFAIRVLRGFRANQGYLLAGAVAYNTLLSILPLLILILIVMANFVEETALLSTLGRYLDLVVPGQSDLIMGELAVFLEHRHVIGWVLVATLLFFSSLAFTVLENAMSVIFYHRVKIRRRHFLISALIPFFCILFLGIGALIVTFVAGALQAMGQESIEFLGRTRSLVGVSGFLLYVLGVRLEQQVLHAQKDDGLHEELQPLALPVLERRTPELRPEVSERKRLAVLACLVAHLDQHGDELRAPGRQE